MADNQTFGMLRRQALVYMLQGKVCRLSVALPGRNSLLPKCLRKAAGVAAQCTEQGQIGMLGRSLSRPVYLLH